MQLAAHGGVKGWKMRDWCSPADQWPKHPGSETRKALLAARREGWWLRPAGPRAHIYGTLTCRAPEDGVRLGEGNCRLPVFSTAGPGDEDTAHVIRKQLAGCQHEDPTSETADREVDPDRLWAAHRHMDAAEKLIAAAERLLQRQGHLDRVEELLTEAASSAELSEQMLEQAERAEEAAEEASQESRRLASDADYGSDPWPPSDSSARLVGPADHHLSTADDLLEPSGEDSVERARARLGVLQGCLDACREALRP